MRLAHGHKCECYECKVDPVYPCVVVHDRYGGTYSGAKWTAFHAYDAPVGPSADDVSCANFWDDADDIMPIGRGQDPDTAVADLSKKVRTRKP